MLLVSFVSMLEFVEDPFLTLRSTINARFAAAKYISILISLLLPGTFERIYVNESVMIIMFWETSSSSLQACPHTVTSYENHYHYFDRNYM